MASYSKLLSALLRAGLADVGFTKSDGYLIRDSSECIGGLYFQKSRYEANDFFVEAGVLSKRLDRFDRLGRAREDRQLYQAWHKWLRENRR